MSHLKNGCITGRFQILKKFHSFQDEDGVAGCHRVAGSHPHVGDYARHGSGHRDIIASSLDGRAEQGVLVLQQEARVLGQSVELRLVLRELLEEGGDAAGAAVQDAVAPDRDTAAAAGDSATVELAHDRSECGNHSP